MDNTVVISLIKKSNEKSKMNQVNEPKLKRIDLKWTKKGINEPKYNLSQSENEFT